MMKNEHWADRLSEHLDGELSPSERAACEAHLASCGECASTLEELRAVVAQASLLPDVPAGRDLWPEIEGRLAPRGGLAGTLDPAVVPLHSRRRRVVMTVPQLAAAAVALVVLSAGAVWLALPGQVGTAVVAEGPAGDATSVAAPGTAPAGVEPQVRLAAAYDPAISQLEQEFDRRREELDPETIRVVQQNLAIIDEAITEAGRALAKDPSSAFLNTHLASAMRRKVDLLRRVTAIERVES